MIDGKAVGNKTLKLINMLRFVSLETYNIVFIDKLKQSPRLPILERIKSLPVLAMRKGCVFLNAVWMVGFKKQNDTIQRRIELRPVELARLIIRSFLLNPANVRGVR